MLLRERKLFPNEVALLSRQLSYLAKLSLPFPEALKDMAKACPNPQLALIAENLSQEMKKGKSLSEGLSPYVPAPVSGLLRFGEKTNQLEKALQEISNHYEAQDNLERGMKSQLYYPYILAFCAVVLSVFSLFFLWPKTAVLLLSLPLSPSLALFYKAMAKLASLQISIILAFAVLLFFFFLWFSGTVSKLSLYLLFLFPLSKRAYKTASLSKIYRVLSLLLGLNYPLSKAVSSAAEISDHPSLSRELKRAEALILKGASLEKAFHESPNLYSPLIGEALGREKEPDSLAGALSFAADLLEQEYWDTTGTLLLLIEPLSILAVGVIVLCGISFFWVPFYQTVGRIVGP